MIEDRPHGDRSRGPIEPTLRCVFRTGMCLQAIPLCILTQISQLLMEASCTDQSWIDVNDRISESTPVKVCPHDNVLKLRYESGGTFAGFVLSQAVPRLINEHSVTLTAYLAAPIGRRFVSCLSNLQVRTLRVVVYGFSSSREAVKTILDQEDRFLQRPEDYEYDQRVRYLNPMYFTRPGEDTPRIAHRRTAVSLRENSAASSGDALDEVQKSRVLKIFDEATHCKASNASGVKQSPRIISKLKE